MRQQTQVHIIYDGDCPFCTAFSQLIRLQENYAVELLNARQFHPLIEMATAKGLDLDEGFIIVLDNTFYHGEDAMTRLALLTAKNGVFRRFTKWVFINPSRSRFLYPILRRGRNLSLKVLGRQQIRNLQTSDQ